MNFFINKNATLPKLYLSVVDTTYNNITMFNEKLLGSTITISIFKQECQSPILLCSPMQLVQDEDCGEGCEQYYLVYQLPTRVTSKQGEYFAKVNITFANGEGTLIAPIRESLNIFVV